MAGLFPNCGCKYTTEDDGIHFCPLHAAAPDLLEACQTALGAYDALRLAGAHRALPGYADCLDELKAAIAKAGA